MREQDRLQVINKRRIKVVHLTGVGSFMKLEVATRCVIQYLLSMTKRLYLQKIPLWWILDALEQLFSFTPMKIKVLIILQGREALLELS
jgi:hypothetical protein